MNKKVIIGILLTLAYQFFIIVSFAVMLFYNFSNNNAVLTSQYVESSGLWGFLLMILIFNIIGLLVNISYFWIREEILQIIRLFILMISLWPNFLVLPCALLQFHKSSSLSESINFDKKQYYIGVYGSIVTSILMLSLVTVIYTVGQIFNAIFGTNWIVSYDYFSTIIASIFGIISILSLLVNVMSLIWKKPLLILVGGYLNFMIPFPFFLGTLFSCFLFSCNQKYLPFGKL